MKNNIPLTTVDWSQRFRRKKVQYMIFAFVISLFVSLNIFKQLEQAKTDLETVGVLVAGKDLKAAEEITNDDLRFVKVKKGLLPKNVFYSKEALLGKKTKIGIYRNQIITDSFIVKRDPNSIGAGLLNGKKAMAIGLDWLEAPLPAVKKGDLIDIVVSEAHKIRNQHGEQIIAPESKLPVQDIKVLQVKRSKRINQKGFLLLEVTDEQAKNLMAIKALKVLMNIIIK